MARSHCKLHLPDRSGVYSLCADQNTGLQWTDQPQLYHVQQRAGHLPDEPANRFLSRFDFLSIHCQRGAQQHTPPINRHNSGPQALSLTSSVSVGTCVDCTHSSVKKPGYKCGDGVVSLCPAGYYCPLNVSTGTYNIQRRCPSDFICFSGFISPIACREGQKCDAGATNISQGWGALVAMVWICMCCCCMICCVQRNNRLELEQSEAARKAFTLGEGEKLGQDYEGDCPAVAIEFRDVGMTLKKGGKCILSGVTGTFPVGSLIALMGPSGGGKTTFMNALLGRANYADVTGEIKVNGVNNGFKKAPNSKPDPDANPDPDWKAANRLGFVPQDDILHADLTVFQNLW